MSREIFLAIGACAGLVAGTGCTQAHAPAPPPSAATQSAEVPKDAMPADPYLAEVTKFRQDREATLKSDAGWLTIAGLWFLTQPQTTFGSDPLNDIVFPASAPPRAGTFEMRSGKVMVKAAEGVTFELNGQEFVGLNGGPQFKFTEAVSFAINCETQEEIDYYWEKLTAGGGEEVQCGWLTDKFGLSWQVVPTRIREWASEPAGFQRVMHAIMPMKKLDLATLQRAFDEK